MPSRKPYGRRPPAIKKKFAVAVPGTEKPITEHSCLSDCLARARDAIKQGARTVSIIKLKTVSK